MENKILDKRKEKIISFLKEKKDWIFYILLAFITFLGCYIRTRNISALKDITTGTWTLGPDLDPFLFLRWAKYIVENGKLMSVDLMRYVPFGYDTSSEMKLLSYLMAWFYKFLSIFSSKVTVTYAAIWFPVAMFGLATIAFFLFARKVFYKESKISRNVIALISTAFLVVIPSLLSRTIAGIPEKESASFFFIFIALYFILEAFTAKSTKKGIIFGVLSGISTALLALIWGGVIFIYFTIAATFLIAFIFGKVKFKEILIYFSWLFSSFILMMPFSTRYTPINLASSLSTGAAIGSLAIVCVALFLSSKNFSRLEKIRRKTKLPKEIFSLIVSVLIIFVIVLIVLGPGLVFSQVLEVKNSLIQPQVSRFGLTVAENKQPYFKETWRDSFGPVVFNIPLLFWLFILGSVTLFGNLIKNLSKKEKIILIFSYFVFLICLIFSRYSVDSILDGVSWLSLFVYFFGWVFFIGTFGYYYFKRIKQEGYLTFQKFNFAYLLYFILLTLGIIGARGGVRLIMLLGAVCPIAAAFIVVKISQKFFSTKEDSMKLFVGVIALVIILASIFTFWNYYQVVSNQSPYYAPGPYQWQWQNAMSWVRNNTAIDAVFAHWWDYGYWVQSIGERATILDGGNAYVYWNHLMGRHVLTSPDEKDALEFLYAHNGTHLLIDSTDIGKYTAYSSIGSDENYDRFSWISTFLLDESQTQETNNETLYLYIGGSIVDEDIVWKQGEEAVFLPRKNAAVGGFILRRSGEDLMQPLAVFIYNNKQYRIPLRYAFFRGHLVDFGSGLDAGVFVFPRLVQSSSGVQVSEIGALLYLSPRTIHSQIANLYLFDKGSENFKLVHKEESYVVRQIKENGLDVGDFVYFQDFQGPIKIWELEYPSNIQLKEEYLVLGFPDPKLNEAKPGEY